MENTYHVLDHGIVKLEDFMGSDESIVRSARVSYDGKAGLDLEKDQKLIRYLMKNRHTTPFEAVQFTFFIKAPIFVFRQWHRHRTWSFNEVSARYTELPEEVYYPNESAIGKQSDTNKQAREYIPMNSQLRQSRRHELSEYEAVVHEAFTLYHRLIKSGWPRELARGILPVATYSKMYASVDLHNLFHFLKLRLHEHAQYEIRVYAEAMLELIRPIVPIAVEAWEVYILNAK